MIPPTVLASETGAAPIEFPTPEAPLLNSASDTVERPDFFTTVSTFVL